MNKGQEMYARLSALKDVLCQPILCNRCNYEFGFVHDPTVGVGIGPGSDPDDLLRPRRIYLWGGWETQPVDGFVSLNKRAARRMKEGKSPTYRRSRYDGPENIAYSPEYNLPVALHCPQCNEKQVLDKDRLNADRVHEDDGEMRIIKVSRASVGRRRLKSS